MDGRQVFGQGTGADGGPTPVEIGGESRRDEGGRVGGSGERARQQQYDDGNEDVTNFSTECRLVESVAASSLTKCGRLPVCSSCRIVPTTISSLIPSTSILLHPSAAGEGGGERVTLGLGRDDASLMRMVVDRGGLMRPGVDEAECGAACARLVFLTGGSSGVTTGGGGTEG